MDTFPIALFPHSSPGLERQKRFTPLERLYTPTFSGWLPSWKNSCGEKGDEERVQPQPSAGVLLGFVTAIGRRRTYQRDGVGERATQDVADLTELHPRHVGVQDLHLHRLVFPAPLLVGDARCGEEEEEERPRKRRKERGEEGGEREEVEREVERRRSRRGGGERE